MAGPPAVGMSGLQRSARAAAVKSKSKQTALNAAGRRGRGEPAAAKTPILLADPVPPPCLLHGSPCRTLQPPAEGHQGLLLPSSRHWEAAG